MPATQAMIKYNELSQKGVWILDFDGLMYPLDGIFCQELYGKIAANFNELTAGDPAVLEAFQAKLGEGSGVADAANITAADLKAAYMPIIQILIEMAGPDIAAEVLDDLYGDGYEQIQPDEQLVKAFKVAKSKGIKIVFNTNGTSSKKRGQDFHVQRAMRALGFDEDTINEMRGNTYDIFDVVKGRRGKDDPNMLREDLFSFAGIEDADQAFAADDGVTYLKAAHEAGLTTIWAHTTDADPKPGHAEIAAEIGAFRVRNVGDTLLRIAEGYEPKAA